MRRVWGGVGGVKRGRERPGALSFKLGPGSHYLSQTSTHTTSNNKRTPGLLRTLHAGGSGMGGEGRGGVVGGGRLEKVFSAQV